MILINQTQDVKVLHKRREYWRFKSVEGNIIWYYNYEIVDEHMALELEQIFNDGVIQKLPELFTGIEVINDKKQPQDER